ncbi:MAG TPA: putative porin [Deltaproteobacteria bacterium]|nr:putative porin [Deltaproteobacteria bacterium]HQI01016.1 putative porin [Deltaproteobacteria bacterium]
MNTQRVLLLVLCLCICSPVIGWCQNGKDGTGEDAKQGITLAKCIEEIDISGDLRIRYEHRDLDDSGEEDSSLKRMQTRFRLGFVWKPSSGSWEVGAGLATGGPVATSANNTWSDEEFFEKGDIRLDYAYARHVFKPFEFIAGQQKNPFETTWVMWDTDVRPAGLTLKAEQEPLFITAGAFDVIQRETNFGILYAVQAGVKAKVQGAEVTLAAAYYDFDDEFEEEAGPSPQDRYNVVDLYGQVEVEAGGFTIGPYAQVFKNIGAGGDESAMDEGIDPDNNDLGWVAGAVIGFMKFEVDYTYIWLEADSFVGGLTDATFGSGIGPTDIKGHRITVSYAFTECFSLGTNFYIYEAIKRDDVPDGFLYHIEANYKF